MKEKQTQSQVLFGITASLPDFCESFLIGRSSERSLPTRIGYARDISAFLDWCILYLPYFCEKEKKDITFADMEMITPEDIDKYITSYAETHSSSATSRAKGAVSMLYRYLLHTLEKVTHNPVDGAQKVRREKKDYVVYLSIEEQERLLHAITTGEGLSGKQVAYHEKLWCRDLAMVYLFLDTGLRVSELQGLDNGDLNLEACSAIVRRKGGKLSEIFYSDAARNYLIDYLEEKKSFAGYSNNATDPLFLSLNKERISIREIQKIVPKYVKAALPSRAGQITPHKLRSSFAMSFYGETSDILTLQERMGHESIISTNIYAKAAKEKIRESRNWRQ